MSQLTDHLIKNQLVAFLQKHIGDMLTPHAIAKQNGLPKASTRQSLVELAEAGRIRRSGTRSALSFYVPSKQQLEAENKQVVDRFKPLKPRPLMAERIAEIRAARAAIPSIT